jgi:thioesterase domain-containing protein
MAALYASEIRRVQPTGPYRLGGWSMGAVIAFEIARQIHADGDAVSLLALIDPGVAEDPFHDDDDATLIANIFREAPIPTQLQDLPYKLDVPARELVTARYRAHHHAIRHYRPRPLPGSSPTILFRAEQSPPESAQEFLMLCRSIEVVAVQGDHFSILEPTNVGVIASKLAARLAAR